MLRGRECILCGDGNLHHEGTAQIIRTKYMQEDLERLSSCTGFGEKMAQYMSRDIDFDTVDYEEEND